MKHGRLEPGLLAIFRLFLLVQLAMILINLHVHSNRGLMPADPAVVFSVIVAGFAILFGYLSWSRLQTAFGRFYLPAAVAFSIALSLSTTELFLNMPLSVSNHATEEGAWTLFIYLFVPLVLVGWQYGFRWVIVYCLFTTALEFALLRWADPRYDDVHETYQRLLFIRFVSFLLAGYVVSRIMQQLRRERHALQEANKKLGSYVAALEQLTVSRERNRMARELHDTLAHTLSAVAVQLEAVNALWTSDRDRAFAMVQRCLDVTRKGLTETRNAIQSLRATPLEDLGLIEAVRSLAESTIERAGFRLAFDSADNWSGLPPEVEQCFYRIAQEALENAVRHSRAQIVSVRFTGDGEALVMEIADDGTGFDSRAIGEGRHFGLRGMEERSAIIGGNLTVLASPGQGVKVTLRWQREKKEGGAR